MLDKFFGVEFVMPAHLSAADFGSPQSRSRIYVLMVRDDLVTRNKMELIVSTITQTLPPTLGRRATMRQVSDYTKEVLSLLGQEPSLPPTSQDVGVDPQHSSSLCPTQSLSVFLSLSCPSPFVFFLRSRSQEPD